VQFDFESGFSTEGVLPAVVGVRLGSTGYFIAILREEGDKFLVGDPLNGGEILSRGGQLHAIQVQWLSRAREKEGSLRDHSLPTWE
jgi:hypothetical protein